MRQMNLPALDPLRPPPRLSPLADQDPWPTPGRLACAPTPIASRQLAALSDATQSKTSIESDPRNPDKGIFKKLVISGAAAEPPYPFSPEVVLSQAWSLLGPGLIRTDGGSTPQRLSKSRFGHVQTRHKSVRMQARERPMPLAYLL
jgi:hypothetical protein